MYPLPWNDNLTVHVIDTCGTASSVVKEGMYFDIGVSGYRLYLYVLERVIFVKKKRKNFFTDMVMI